MTLPFFPFFLFFFNVTALRWSVNHIAVKSRNWSQTAGIQVLALPLKSQIPWASASVSSSVKVGKNNACLSSVAAERFQGVTRYPALNDA